MNLFISVVNHAHDEMIVTNPTLALLAKQYKVVVKSNTVASEALSNYCLEHGIMLIHGD
nr:glycosyltransferase family 2 protein [Vibrio anguillarum]